MIDAPNKKRQRQTAQEGVKKVTNTLEEARRLVDAVTGAEETPGPPISGSMPSGAAATAAAAAPKPPDERTTPAVKRPASRSKRAQKAAPPAEVKPLVAIPPQDTAATTPSLPPEMLGIHILHRVPGRTRLKIRQMHHNAAFAQTLAERLGKVPGVTGVQTNVVTGSLVFFYNPFEFRQPAAQRVFQEAWQDLFPRLQTEKLTAALITLGRS